MQTISEKQRKLFNKGKLAYIKRLTIIGAVGGILFGCFVAFMLYKSNTMFSPDKPVFGKMFTGFIIPFIGFGMLGLVMGMILWSKLKFRIIDAVEQSLHINKHAKQDIQSRFGNPVQQTNNGNTEIWQYSNTFDKANSIKISKAQFEFENNILANYRL